MNRYALYALKSDGNDYARTDALENCSFNGGTKFTFGMDIYCTMQNGLVFSQNNSISCFLQSGSIVWKGIEWELIADKSYSAVMMDEWNHIDVVYDTNKVSLYLNGVLASETQLETKPVYSTEEYRYLGGYGGYIKNVRIVDHAMTEKEIRENLIITVIPEEKLWLYIPFDSTEPEDKGIYKKQVQCKGFCYCKDFVKALYFTGKGYALLDGVLDNPGSKQCPAFTIVMRIFPDGYTSDTAVLFENSGSNDLLQICLLNESKLQINIGTNQIVTDGIQAIEDCVWTDIAVSVNGNEVKIYAGGALIKTDTIESYVRTSYPHMVLGNHFIGAIDYFAIYGKVLTDDYIAGIHNIEPYIFDNGINSLFLFHGEKETNMLGSGSVLLHDEAAFSMLEGTLYGIAPEKFDYRIDEEYRGSDLEEWAIALLGGLGIAFAAVAVGIAMKGNALNAGLKKVIAEQVLFSNEAQSILGNYANITEKELESLISTTTAGPEMVSACTSAMAKTTITGAAAVAAVKASTYPIFLATTVGALAVGSIITAALVSSTKPSDPPKEEEEEKKPEKGYNLYLESIQLRNDSNGSIPLRTDFDTKQTLPEWEKGKSESIVCAYIAKQQAPKIVVRFKYVPSKDQKSAKVKIHLGNFELLGNGESNVVECSVPDTLYEAEIICNNNKLHEAGMGKTSGKVSFRYEPVDAGKDVPTNSRIKFVDMDIHTLCKEPIEPWSITDETKAPIIPVLDVAAEIAEKLKIRDEQGFMEAITKWFQRQSYLTLESNSKYAIAKYENIEFAFRDFWEEYRKDFFKAGILDYYLFTLEFAHLEGMNLILYEISTMEQLNIAHDGKGTIESLGILVNPCVIFGKSAKECYPRTYLLGTQNHENNYWDILFQKDGHNMTWEQYKNEVLQKECYVYEPQAMNNWNEITVNTNVINNAIFKTEDSLSNIFFGTTFYRMRRWGFKSYVNKLLIVAPTQARCHRVSYEVIEILLISIFECFRQGNIDVQVKNALLEKLKEAFYPNNYCMAWDAEKQNFEELSICIHNLETIQCEDLKNKDMISSILDEMNRTVVCLNSSLYNLREGNSRWNSSIQSFFDPEEWFLVYGGNEIANQTEVGLKKPVNLPNGYYFANEKDVHMLEMLLYIGKTTRMSYLWFDIRRVRVNENVFPVIASSNNKYDMEGDTTVSPFDFFYIVNGNPPVRFCFWDNDSVKIFSQI